MYKLKAVDWNLPLDERRAKWWNNLINHINISPMRSREEFDKLLNTELKKFNGRDLPKSEYIEFDTEEDALAFLLKYS